MTGKATITFSQTGVQPPVYVVSSLSDWEMLELNVEEEQTTSGDTVFTKQFDNVAEGSYQYKIRIGEGHWVVDESKETATDEHGNRNNVVHAKPESNVGSSPSPADRTTDKEVASEVAQHKSPPDSLSSRKDSTMDFTRPDQLPNIPVPFVVVEKVPDKDQPEYGHVEPESLPSDAAKRAADAEPDFEEIREDSSSGHDLPKSLEVPLVVVEKADDKPAFGDDFGENATPAQKAAHEMRTADASPDRLVISPDHTEAGAEEHQPAPLFAHESVQADDPPLASPMETIDEESLQSSADLTSSSEVINTPSEADEYEEDELNQCPLLPHEAGFDDRNGETELEAEDVGELDHSPLLPHENGSDHDSGVASDEEDEFARAPLLPHESGFSDYRRSENSTNSGFLDDENVDSQHSAPHGSNHVRVAARTLEPDHEPTFSHGYGDEDEDDLLDGEYDDTPLLPHERDPDMASNGSELSADDAHYLQHGRPTFEYENDNSRGLFGGSGRPDFFRSRTNSSSLPHKLPRSDAEDENLDDPSLERFPTSREQILERVASIGLQLPEDETIEDSLHSPQLSVLSSQACSSVELAPIKSYTSLASVPEADDSDEEEDQDVESLPSPITFGGARSRGGFARDPHATPLADDRKQLEHAERKALSPDARKAESSESESVGKHDGAKDTSTILSTLRETVATPSKILDPITPPLTPEHKTPINSREDPATSTESQLRQRREQTDDSTDTSRGQEAVAQGTEENDKPLRTTTPALAQQPDKQDGNFLQNFIRIVFGSVGRLLAVCAGDRKRASTTVLVVGVGVAAYYSLALAS